MAVTTVQIRLVADSAEEAAAAIAALRDAVGAARVALGSPRMGRKGGYLAYGTLQVETGEMSPIGDTSTAATGKTTRLPKR